MTFPLISWAQAYPHLATLSLFREASLFSQSKPPFFSLKRLSCFLCFFPPNPEITNLSWNVWVTVKLPPVDRRPVKCCGESRGEHIKVGTRSPTSSTFLTGTEQKTCAATVSKTTSSNSVSDHMLRGSRKGKVQRPRGPGGFHRGAQPWAGPWGMCGIMEDLMQAEGTANNAKDRGLERLWVREWGGGISRENYGLSFGWSFPSWWPRSFQFSVFSFHFPLNKV